MEKALLKMAYLVILVVSMFGVAGAYAARSLELEPPAIADCTTDAQCRTPLHPSFKCVKGKCICPKGTICLDQP
ncbi:hypothetical protein RHGRI_027060 [Rhododendron griersonianum]|uniref:Uncharacterized protein n=1 Tax=Rhododendron griersonianum TaxID=479676 RepID=A0AAV6J0R0_9ERIC|nr:hypothetical protein RHGRI_027060 [Rhododendron griersonianum]